MSQRYSHCWRVGDGYCTRRSPIRSQRPVGITLLERITYIPSAVKTWGNVIFDVLSSSFSQNSLDILGLTETVVVYK